MVKVLVLVISFSLSYLDLHEIGKVSWGCTEMPQLLQRPRGLGTSSAYIMDRGRPPSTPWDHTSVAVSGQSLGVGDT